MSRPAVAEPHEHTSRLGELLARWFERRNGPRVGEQRLTQRNVYILPSRAGLLYGGVLLAMLVASINYQLSLGYGLTFLLGGVAIVGILHGFRNLSGLVLRPGRAEPVFAGQLAEFSLMLANPGRLERHAIRLLAPGMAAEAIVDLPPASEQMVSIAIPTARRGWLQMPRVRLSTRFPLGIWTAWGYWRPAMRVLVYPTPETPAAPLPELSAIAGEGDGSGRGEDDVAAIRPYVIGDPPRRIAWKAVARTGSDELLSKQFDGGWRGELWLDWAMLPAQLDTEARLSRLARWVVDAEAGGARYALPRGAGAGRDMKRAHGLRLGYSLRALGGRLGEQWERERRDTLFLMGATLVAALPHFAHLPWWTSAVFVLLFAWRLVIVLTGRSLPGDAVRWIAAIACTVAVFAHYRTLLGREPGVALLVLFLGLKLMEMRARRDLFVVLFLCFFLLLTGFFYSQSALAAAVTLVAVLALIAAMLTMQFGQHEVSIPRRLRAAASLALQALPIAAVLFVLFPRIEGPLWSLPEDAHGASTGLTNSMRPGAIAQLSQSDEVAFRVRFESAAPPPSRMYWRGPVFGSYDGRDWRPLARAEAPLPTPEVRYPAQRPPVRYAVTLEPTHRTWLFALEAPVRVGRVGSSTALVGPELLLQSREPIVERTRYEVDSQLDYALGDNETPASLRNWLALPPGFDPRSRELARRWRSEATQDGAGDAAIVERALAMIREQPFRYTLNPPLLGRNGIDDFLFGTRAGFCEHYASAFTVLMRAAGVPARVVTGYQGAELNPVDDYWIVRQADAHAWSEVWLAGRGWVRVDPTAAVAPERIERGSRALRGEETEGSLLGARAIAQRWKLNFDALANAWNQWVLSYDRERQARLLARFGLAFDDWRDLAAALAVVLTLVIGALAVAALRPRHGRDPVERLWREFCDRLAVHGMPRLPHETAAGYVARIERGLEPEQLRQARRIVLLYNRLRYSGEEPDALGMRNLRTQIRSFTP